MTPREIILANITHGSPQRVGLNFAPVEGYRGRRNDMVGSGLGPSQTWTQTRRVEGRREYYDDAWGNVWVRMAVGAASGEVHQPALDDWAKLDTLKLPDFDAPARYERAREAYAAAGDSFKLFFVPGWVFATSRYLRKMEVYFMDLIEYPDEIACLHELVTGLFVKVIHLAADAGADAVFYCEDLGVQDRLLIGPQMWREVFAPHYRRLTSAAHERGLKVLMHSCGYNWDLVDDLAESGIDCLQFDQPAAYDMPALAEKLRKHKVGLWSPVDIQKVMPTGDKDLIQREARRLVETFRGGLICKNYPDLPSIGVKPEWDQWAYEAVLEAGT